MGSHEVLFRFSVPASWLSRSRTVLCRTAGHGLLLRIRDVSRSMPTVHAAASDYADDRRWLPAGVLYPQNRHATESRTNEKKLTNQKKRRIEDWKEKNW